MQEIFQQFINDIAIMKKQKIEIHQNLKNMSSKDIAASLLKFLNTHLMYTENVNVDLKKMVKKVMDDILELVKEKELVKEDTFCIK